MVDQPIDFFRGSCLSLGALALRDRVLGKWQLTGGVSFCNSEPVDLLGQDMRRDAFGDLWRNVSARFSVGFAHACLPDRDLYNILNGKQLPMFPPYTSHHKEVDTVSPTSHVQTELTSSVDWPKKA